MAAEQLKLQVILDAADKFTAPIRRAMSASESFETQLKSTKTALQALQGQSADIAAYRKLTSQITDTAASMVLAENKVSKYQASIKESKTVQQTLTRELTRSEVELNDLRKQMQATENPSKKLVQNFNEAEETVKTLSKRLDQAETDTQNYTAQLTKSQQSLTKTKTKHDSYNKVLGDTKKRLKEAGISTKNLASHESRLKTEIDQATQSLTKQAGQLKKVADQQKQLNKLRNFKDRSMQRASNMTIQGGGAMYAGKSVLQTAAQPLAGAIEDEAAFSGVKKVVNFEGIEDQLKFKRSLQDLAIKEIPLAAEGLYEIAESGGRLGVEKGNLVEFTRTVAIMSTAFDMEAGQSGDRMAKVSNIYKMPIAEMSDLGDAINHLDNNTASKASEITEVMLRAGGTAKQFGLETQELAALGSTFLALGKTPEVAATGINALLLKMQTATNQGKPFKQGLDEMGVSAEALEAAVRVSGAGALTDFLKKLEQLPDERRMNIVGRLFGNEYADDISALVGGLGNYEKAMELVSKKSNYENSMQEEFRKKSESTKNQLQLLENQKKAISTEIGSAMLPALNQLITTLRPVLNTVMEWVRANPQLVAQLGYAAAGIGGLVVAGGALTLALGSVLGPLALMRYGIGVIGLKSAAAGGALGKLGGIFRLVKGAAGLLFRVLTMHPLGRLVAVIGGAAYALWKNWDAVKGKFSGYWDATKTKWSHFSNWWSTTSFKEKSLQISAKGMELARNAGQNIQTWWTGSTFVEKSLSLKAGAIALAKTGASKVLDWWNNSKLKQKTMSLSEGPLKVVWDKAKQFTTWWDSISLKAIGSNIGEHLRSAATTAKLKWVQFKDWWSGLSLDDLTPIVGVKGVQAAKAKYQELSNWWNTTSFVQKAMDIVTTPATIARSLVTPVFNWWNNETLTEKQMALNTTGVTNGKATIQTVLGWWSSVGIKDRLIAFQQGPLQSSITGIQTKVNSLLSWWDTVDLHDVGYGVGSFIRKALKTIRSKAEEFMTWWNNLSLKSLIPEIKMPTIAGIKKAMSGGAGGIASSVGKAASSMAKGASNFVGGLVSGLRGDPKPDGSRANGGPVLSDSFYRVNELGPELLNIQGSTYLMMGGAGGHITPLGQAGAFQSLQSNSNAEAVSNNGSTTNNSRYANTSKTLNSSMMKQSLQAQTSQATTLLPVAMKVGQNTQSSSNSTALNDTKFAHYQSQSKDRSASSINTASSSGLVIDKASNTATSSSLVIDKTSIAQLQKTLKETVSNDSLRKSVSALVQSASTRASNDSTSNTAFSSLNSSMMKHSLQAQNSKATTLLPVAMKAGQNTQSSSNSTALNDAQFARFSVTANNTLREIQQYQQKTGLTTANDSRFNASTIEKESRFSDQKVIDLLTRSSQAESLVTSRQGGSGSGASMPEKMTLEMHVHASPGMNEQELADKTTAMFDRWWEQKQREAERRGRSQLFDEVG